MNFVRTLRLRALCAGALVWAFSAVAHGASDWQVVKVGRWDYLTVDNIAKFYGFGGDLTPVNKTIRLDNGRNQLEVTLDSREAIVNGVRNWLCFPVIANSDGKFLVSRIDLAKTLEPQFRPHMIAKLGRFTTVVIDPGHGGIEKGAASSYGLEKDFSLDVARQLKPLLEAKGLKVVMTREGDQQVPLPQRARVANGTKDCIFVSIHFNATDHNPTATGFEIYSLTPRGAPSTQDNTLRSHFGNMQNGTAVDAASLALSTSVYHSMLAHMPEFDRGVKRARFAVLRLTQVPAILVEGGFLTERQESRNIASKEWRGKLAQAISVGIDNYRGLVEKRQRPMMLADYRRQYEGVLVARDPSVPITAPGRNIMPASNSRSLNPLARLTAALRHEPSPQISISGSENDDEEHSTAGAPPATVAAAPGAPEPSTDEALQRPAEAPNAEALAPTAAATMPGDTAAPQSDEPAPDEQPAADLQASSTPPIDQAPAPETASATTNAASEPAPSATPAAPQIVRKYWVLKFDPPPKFRQ